jgi:hypothetical protein
LCVNVKYSRSLWVRLKYLYKSSLNQQCLIEIGLAATHLIWTYVSGGEKNTLTYYPKVFLVAFKSYHESSLFVFVQHSCSLIDKIVNDPSSVIMCDTTIWSITYDRN